MKAVLGAMSEVLYSVSPQVTHLRETGRFHVYKNNKYNLSTDNFLNKFDVLYSLYSYEMTIG